MHKYKNTERKIRHSSAGIFFIQQRLKKEKSHPQSCKYQYPKYISSCEYTKKKHNVNGYINILKSKVVLIVCTY
jgi:hypothetical protein